MSWESNSQRFDVFRSWNGSSASTSASLLVPAFSMTCMILLICYGGIDGNCGHRGVDLTMMMLRIDRAGMSFQIRNGWVERSSEESGFFWRSRDLMRFMMIVNLFYWTRCRTG